ncbi:putative membrane protein [Agrobacterium vitis]|nr:putative membrane protein [Agrobacterium vitis]MBE1438344.1 putative membrane protein [Agrobacterium vitis]
MTQKKKPFLLGLRRHRHSPFYAASLLGLLTLPAFLLLRPGLAVESSAIVFFLVYLGFMIRRIPKATSERLKTSPERDDAPAVVIPMVSLLAIIASVVALFNALNKGESANALEVSLAFLSVISGWFTIHTMFAMHYAHRYWQYYTSEQGLGPRRGLSFPETEEPGGYEFLYFSFVIGMTAQTSDVAITTTDMRRINLAHAVVAFFFNTILVAAAVNAVVSMAG